MALQLLIAAYSDTTTEMKIIPITKIEVINTIKSLETNNLSGYDDNILINCTNVISKPFTFRPTPHTPHTYNKCKYVVYMYQFISDLMKTVVAI